VNNILSKFKSSNERSAKAIKSIFYIFLFKGGNMAINLLLVPLTIKLLNVFEYGLWLTISSIIAWFSIVDVGFGQGLRNKFVEAVAVGDTKLAQSYVSTTYFFLAGFLFLVWVVFFITNYYIDWSVILNIDESLSSEMSSVVLIFLSFFLLQFVFKLVGIVLTANQEPGKSAQFDFVSNVLCFIAILFMVIFNIKGSLKSLAIIVGVAQLIVYLIATFVVFNNRLKLYRPSLSTFRIKYIKSIMGLGIKFFIIQFAAIFIFQSTNLIITQKLGAEQVSIYNIAYKYFTIPMTIGLIIIAPLWSAFTDAYVKNDYDWMKNVNKKIFYLLIIIVALLIILYLISDIVYYYWIGENIKIDKDISFMMMLNIITATIFSILIVIINGFGKLKLQLIASVIISILFYPLSFYLCDKFGLKGMLYSNIIVNVVYIILIYIQSQKLIYNKAYGIWNK
jgi:O-antigen/teichoic acid export membrane protein